MRKVIAFLFGLFNGIVTFGMGCCTIVLLSTRRSTFNQCLDDFMDKWS